MHRRFLLLWVTLGIVGCGARAEVAKDKFVAQVDALLGEIDVKRKEAEIAVRNLQSGIDRFKKGGIEAKVRLAQISDKLAGLEMKIADADRTLERLREYLKEEKDVEISGKTFTVVQLKGMAETTISARRKLGVEAEALRGSQKRLESVVASLSKREQEGKDRLNGLKVHLDEIDSKAVALKSIQDASALTGGTDALDFEAVEKQVRDLRTKIDVELTYQDEKWKDGSTESDLASLDQIMQETSTTSDTVSEIDKLLGGE